MVNTRPVHHQQLSLLKLACSSTASMALMLRSSRHQRSEFPRWHFQIPNSKCVTDTTTEVNKKLTKNVSLRSVRTHVNPRQCSRVETNLEDNGCHYTCFYSTFYKWKYIEIFDSLAEYKYSYLEINTMKINPIVVWHQTSDPSWSRSR